MRAFTLDHTTTSASLGLRFTGPVEIPAAQRVVEDIDVQGRAGTLTRLGGWHDTVMTLPLAVNLTGGVDAYQRAALALSNASVIGLSGDPGVFRHIKHATISPLRRELASWGMFEAELTCAPFTYLNIGLVKHTLTVSGTITNPGLLDSAPVVTVYGTGMLTLTINGTPYRMSSPSGQVTLDSARLVAHVAGRVQTDALTGDFPRLVPGVNRFVLGTGISSIEVTGNWRNP
ncbi:hypothetical protein EU799_10655 [Corynebacterium silvaticum]|uniref:hypothetical protein n=1 Tax=Corynebacterium silvaticum TaxID=2320431 RepID=UPI0010688511|nr:hypothetical protein [Corynebacterium silvaticum]MBH5299843.1 hypothetical protein [Corynebacterium silvaticum]NOM65736.1 hypothetical protein [Corynebacterium silvaticum]TFA91550.1 hypothetical protein EU802_10335 [Corynebacterium silvaticum]TFA92588.1 hypothetical protein EU799_10655 [Corynebacterium silvaticum]TNX78729.1 hypothetical protein FIT55_11085 [Corynebacterium silvaticum]